MIKEQEKEYQKMQNRVDILYSNMSNEKQQNKVEKENTKTSTNWKMPCNGKIRGVFGEKRSDHIHNGLDVAVPIGTPIEAIADGTVIRTGIATGYGQWVVLDHGKINGVPVTSEYGHISKSCVKIGQKVKKGEVIAKSGNEGRSQGPHLHLTIREGKFRGIGVDPFKYIKY